MVANAWKQVLGGGVALAALFVVVPAASGGRLGWGLIFLAAAALSYHGWVANGAQPPTDWYIWMAALTSWGLGGLVTALGEGSPPAWVPVAFFALGYLLFALGIIWFQQTRVVGVDRDWMIDATIVSTAVGVVLWTTLDITSLAASTLTPVEQSMYALAALVHTSFLAFSVRLLILTRGRLIKNWLGGSAALLGTAGSMAHFVLRVQGSDPAPAGVLALWALAAVVFCSMPNEVTHGKYRREGLTDQGRPLARFAVLASAMMGGTLAIVLQDGINGQRTIPVGGSLLLTFLVLGRLLGLVMARERGKRELEARAAQQGMVADLGQQSLSKADLPTLLGQTVQGIAATLRVDHCGVLELLPGGAVLLLREAFGWPDHAIGSAVISADDRRLSFTALEKEQTVVVADMATDDRLDSPELIGGLAATSVVFTPIGGSEAPYGVLIVACDERRSFTDEEIKFLQAAANVLAVAIERRAREDEIRHRALHDPLTGLPNRALMIDRLTHALAVRTRRAGELAVLFIDLDHFKDVNDRLGHAAGDELLLGVTKRLQETARSEDTISRFAGDEFVIVCERLEGEHDVVGIAERIISALGRPFVIQGQQANVSASVGIALATDEHDSERLLRDADAAMYRAKERGRACFEVFDEIMGARVMRRLRMEQDLYGAPERKELKVVYQPIIALEREEIVGVEALLRWNHPRDGWVSPGDFIPIAEESGLILILGEWVLHQSCRQLARWSREFPDVRPFRVFVNLSARQLMDPNLIEMVLRSLEETGADPTCLGLEITESAAMEDAETASRNLQALKDLGIHLAMDDFGTGYSSLAHLKRFPVDVVKIDASFIDGLGAGAEDEAIVSAIVGMARALDREVLAEGVETQQQAAAVRELGCDFAQGYLFARPIPPVQIDEMLASGALLQRPQMA